MEKGLRGFVCGILRFGTRDPYFGVGVGDPKSQIVFCGILRFGTILGVVAARLYHGTGLTLQETGFESWEAMADRVAETKWAKRVGTAVMFPAVDSVR